MQDKLFIVDILKILNKISYKDWRIELYEKESTMYLQIEFNAKCSVTGNMELQKSRKWLLSPYMTKTEIVKTALLAIKQTEEHELLENFKYNGVRIFNPHHSIDALLSIADKIEIRE